MLDLEQLSVDLLNKRVTKDYLYNSAELRLQLLEVLRFFSNDEGDNGSNEYKVYRFNTQTDLANDNVNSSTNIIDIKADSFTKAAELVHIALNQDAYIGGPTESYYKVLGIQDEKFEYFKIITYTSVDGLIIHRAIHVEEGTGIVIQSYPTPLELTAQVVITEVLNLINQFYPVKVIENELKDREFFARRLSEFTVEDLHVILDIYFTRDAKRELDPETGKAKLTGPEIHVVKLLTEAVPEFITRDNFTIDVVTYDLRRRVGQLIDDRYFENIDKPVVPDESPEPTGDPMPPMQG